MKYTIKPYYSHIRGRQATFDTLAEAINYYDYIAGFIEGLEPQKIIDDITNYGCAIIGDHIIEKID